MNAIRLVPINEHNEPAESGLVLSDVARESCAATAGLYHAAGFDPPWIGYLAVRDGEVVGTCAFNTITFPAPAINGTAEIAYFTFPGFEGQGLATQMAAELIAISKANQPEVKVIAHTLPMPNASNSILKKLGFAFVGPIQHPEDGEIWQWALPNENAR